MPQTRQQSAIAQQEFVNSEDGLLARATVPGFPDLYRPQTTNTANFWYISLQHYVRLAEEVAVPSKKVNAMKQLRKYDTAGRIMETDAGVESAIPCGQCVRRGQTCRSFAEGGTCAWCRRYGRGKCESAGRQAATSTEEQLAALQERVERVERAVPAGQVQSQEVVNKEVKHGDDEEEEDGDDEDEDDETETERGSEVGAGADDGPDLVFALSKQVRDLKRRYNDLQSSSDMLYEELKKMFGRVERRLAEQQAVIDGLSREWTEFKLDYGSHRGVAEE